MNGREAPQRTVSAQAMKMIAMVRTPGQIEVLSRAEIVTQQIESAIGIGILSNGECLPPETVLAEYLGVSPLTLRQSLAVLRSKGLVETRRGRGGGSYVSGHIELQESQIDDRLKSISTDQVRDIIDLMVTAARGAARLAAQRADEQDIARLRALNARFLNSRGIVELRRTDSRFHIGIGVAAQSWKLTSMLVQAQAELAPFTWIGEPSARRANEAVDEHESLILAISRGNVSEAEILVSSHLESDGMLLIDRHLELLTA